jgi:hypothetical protein
MKACPCKTVWYCSTDYQRQHWKKEHAPDLKRILKEQEEQHKKKKEQKKKDAVPSHTYTIKFFHSFYSLDNIMSKCVASPFTACPPS